MIIIITMVIIIIATAIVIIMSSWNVINGLRYVTNWRMNENIVTE